jgi:ABC-type uncharacterized transport system ATPase subunit
MIELKGVSKKFHVFPVVNHVSFSVRPSEVLGYLGPNGAGFIIVLFLEVCQHLFIYEKVQIVYEEEPEPALIGLDPRS